MPDPSSYNSKSKFMSACVPVVLEEGTAKSQKQAVAICNSMWESKKSHEHMAHRGALEDSSMDNQRTSSEQELRRDDLMRVQRVASVDVDSGTFGMTLATEGEASDGHILSIEGARLPERMPMLISHMNEPTRTAGSIFRMRRHLQDSPRRLTAVGLMELDGDGATMSVRRDLMHLISQGHVNAVSVRWDFDWKDVTPRTKLPSDHPHYVDPDKEPTTSNKRYGYFFKKWTPREGSIVALGADPNALIGRARDATGELRTFWERMAEDAKASSSEEETERVMPDLASLVAAFGARVRELGVEVDQLMKLGAPYDELMRIFEQNKPVAPVDEALQRLMQKIDTLEDRLARAEKGRVGGTPPVPDSLANVVRQAVSEIREERRAQFEDFRREIRARRGLIEKE